MLHCNRRLLCEGMIGRGDENILSPKECCVSSSTFEPLREILPRMCFLGFDKATC